MPGMASIVLGPAAAALFSSGAHGEALKLASWFQVAVMLLISSVPLEGSLNSSKLLFAHW